MLSENDIKEELDLSSDDFNKLLELIKSQITQKIGVPLEPTSFTQVEKYFQGDVLIVDNFPIEEIHHFKIGSQNIRTNDYNIDYDTGIIYLNSIYTGFLRLEYTACISTNDYSMYILPLIYDMMEYHLDNGWNKNASSIKEGEITINYDTSLGNGAKIQNTLTDLEERYSSFCRMI